MEEFTCVICGNKLVMTTNLLSAECKNCGLSYTPDILCGDAPENLCAKQALEEVFDASSTEVKLESSVPATQKPKSPQLKRVLEFLHGHFSRSTHPKHKSPPAKTDQNTKAQSNHGSPPKSEPVFTDNYLSGYGAERNSWKTLEILVDQSFAGDKSSLLSLADYFETEFKSRGHDFLKGGYLREIVKGNNPQRSLQYTQTNLKSQIDEINSKVWDEEAEHLQKTQDQILNEIEGLSQESALEKMFSGDPENWGTFDEIKTTKSKKGRKIFELQNIHEEPYYYRFDTLVNKQGVKENKSIYIGKKNYFDPEDNNLWVYSVWSEFGKAARDSRNLEFIANQAHHSIKLRRRIDIHKGRLQGMVDEFSCNLTNLDASDPFLLEVLKRKRDEDGITDIISTIQKNQNEIIDYQFNKDIVVQGCAGSGKTMLLLHRLANIKYNNRETDTRRTIIITPNQEFNIFIDDLSKSLELDTIKRYTIQEYFIELLSRYAYEYETPKKIQQGKSAEKRRVLSDIECPVSYFEKVFSRSFYNAIPEAINEFERLIQKEDIKKRKDYEKDKLKKDLKGDPVDPYEPYRPELFSEKGLTKKVYSSLKKINQLFTPEIIDFSTNYSVVLYAKLLFLFELFGEAKHKDQLVCVDEGQDIPSGYYDLMRKVNGSELIFNIYGDLNQKTHPKGLLSWAGQSRYGKYFELRQNYRNSRDIVTYVNCQLDMNDIALGIDSRAVNSINQSHLRTLIKLNILLRNRVLVVAKSESVLAPFFDNYAVWHTIEIGHASFLTVEQAKGLEFDVVFVVAVHNMTNNEKYISFTRALRELYIVED